tara:strand:- start:35 stop:658 length:624 start_codon:yes stop_codon:yes gene_type:complete
MQNLDLTQRQTHYDIINECYGDIQRAFIEVGGIAPGVGELSHSSEWHYCKTFENKHKSKVGYVCHHEYSGNMPRVRVIVHSFANGGATATFDSRFHQNNHNSHFHNLEYSKIVRRPTSTELKKSEDRKQAEVKRREQLFKDHMSYWQNGSPAIGAHGYVVNKKLDDNRDLKVNRNKLLIPITNLDGEFCAIQSIDYSGRKFIFGNSS